MSIPTEKQLVAAIIRSLTPDLLKERYRKANPNTKFFRANFRKNRVFGHCYIASEALFHMSDKKRSGFVPQVLRYKRGTHWFLRHKLTGRVVDITKSQFLQPVPYELGKGKGFLTVKPSKNARIIIARTRRLLSEAA